MDAALKVTVVPVLHERGFRGSFPHYHRPMAAHLDLLHFQYSSSGDRFVVELSYADSPEANVCLDRDRLLPASRLRVFHTRRRFRLGASNDGGDHWFVFDHAGAATVAASVVQLIEWQGERLVGRREATLADAASRACLAQRRRSPVRRGLLAVIGGCTYDSKDCDVLPRHRRERPRAGPVPRRAGRLAAPRTHRRDSAPARAGRFSTAQGPFQGDAARPRRQGLADTTLAATFAEFNLERMAQDRHAIWTNDPPERHLPGRLPLIVLSQVAGMKEGGIRRLAMQPCGDTRERGECALIDEGNRIVARLPDTQPTELVIALEKGLRAAPLCGGAERRTMGDSEGTRVLSARVRVLVTSDEGATNGSGAHPHPRRLRAHHGPRS